MKWNGKANFVDVAEDQNADFERLSLLEWIVVELLRAPRVVDERVEHDLALPESRVDVQRDVVLVVTVHQQPATQVDGECAANNATIAAQQKAGH